MKYIQLLSDYMYPPLAWFTKQEDWVVEKLQATLPEKDYSQGVYFSDYLEDVDDFDLPSELAKKIKSWDAEFQATLADYPPDSAFKTLDDEEQHWQTGLKIAKELAEYFKGQYRIEYYVNGRGKIWVDI